ncbi:Ig-like domain-containing protein [Rathayibacter sp. YIM 133350]|uniref:Ig-like domain-containing protein n=1 Tax=Rathayibacter sp. YIM 133350 TaxID=3131992 RepID=UPI00307E7406
MRRGGRGRIAMMRAWLAAHRSGLAAALSGSVIVAVVTTIGILSGGYTAQHLDLGDGSVWVLNESKQLIGRANTQVFELNTIVDSGAAGSEIAQSGSNVLVTDRTKSALDIVNAATSEIDKSVPLPPKDPTVSIVGDEAIITAGGDLWSTPVADLAEFDSSSAPELRLGPGSLTSIAADGVMFAFTPATGTVTSVDVDGGDVLATTEVTGLEQTDDFQLTSVAGHWALLDATTLTLHTSAGATPIADLVPDPADIRLQRPGGDGDTVLIAHRTGLVSVPLGGGEARTVVGGRSGLPAAPLAAGACVYAAWGDGISWKRCGSGDGTSSPLDRATGRLQLAFRTNGETVVLNDATTGATWAVQSENRLIDNWDELIQQKHTDNVIEQNNTEDDPELEKAEQPPVAVDDDLGARPGRSTILPVLINDFDPNGDVLVITDLTQPQQGRIDRVSNNQQLQLTLPTTATGSVQFGYTISDGRGMTASASVSVGIRTDSENSPPRQVRETHAELEEGGRVSTQVLGDWVDPDGDAMFLAGAAGPPTDTVAFKPDGTVVFTDGTGSGPPVSVSLTVSDGRDEGVGSLSVKVGTAGDLEITTEPFPALATAGEEITIAPLTHVRGGNGRYRLSSVPAKPDVELTPDFDGGTFRFSSTVVGTHYVEYGVTDGVSNATGTVRVDVIPPSDGPTTPITVPHTAFVRTERATTVDVLATDIDPTGGVLLITAVDDVAAQTGLRVENLEQSRLRVTLTRPLEEGSTSFHYTVSNGLAEAQGTVTVIEVPPPAVRQAPIANDDTASVRVGDVVDIPVLDNDEQPDGEPLTLDPVLPDRPEGSGLLFVSGNVLRYLAPERPGNYTAVYRVDSPGGLFASAQVNISVREADAASNNPPVPRAITARVLAGETVRITVPLTGIDPDGDSVQLIGQETNPQKGSVLDSGSDWFDYQAGEYSTGTDSFDYAVIDALGQRASGTVRIGVGPRADGARNPVAVPDLVLTRPGATVLVRVLDNDSDPDGARLSISSIQPTTAGPTAKVDGELVKVTVPATEGDYGFIYTIENGRGGSSSNFLTVQARTDAPLSRPDARDTVLTLSDVLDRDTVDVAVLANVFFADGPVSSLKLTVLPAYSSSATVTASGTVRVRVRDESQIIPFQVAHPKDPSIVANAFIWVPGYNDALPQVRRSAPALTVVSEGALSIDINKYVVAVGGRKVRLTDSGTVRATHADGADLVADAQTLRFRSAEKYFGPASISFEVTDGTSADDPDGHVATIVLPIMVTARENQPPAFAGAVIDFEPEQQKSIDLRKLTTYPYPDDLDELAYSILDPKPQGFTATLNASTLTVKADSSAPKGTQGTVLIGVRDDANVGASGRILLRVVPSTRPIAVPAPDYAVVARGGTTSIDVLGNDSATNPFPSTPLRVIDVRGVDSGTLPAGVSITPSEDRSTLRVTVARSAEPIDTNLQYQVADATGDPDRFAWGSVRISVQDRPDPVTGVRVTGFGDRSLTVAFDAAGFNNSPITGYTVSLISAATGQVLGSTLCAATTCTVPTPGNGEGNAVLVRVVATNGIGDSDAATSAAPAWSDVVPGAPGALSAAPLDGGLRLSWDAVSSPAGATPVGSYVVTVGGVVLGERGAGEICAAGRCSLDAGGLANGSTVPFSVSARNGAYPALASWNSSSATGVPFGPPQAGGIRADVDAGAGAVIVSWDAFNGNGDPVLGYFVQRLASSAPGDPLPPAPPGACSVSSPAPGTVSGPSGIVQAVDAGAGSARFDGLTDDDKSYNFVVWGYNRSGCTPTEVTGAVVREAPGTTTVDASVVDGQESQDLLVRSARSTGNAKRFDLRLVDAGGNPVGGAVVEDVSLPATPRTLFSRPWGETLRVQLRGCTSWGTCGDWSDTAPANPEPSLTWHAEGQSYDPATGVWSWTNAPGNGTAFPASFRCGLEGSDGSDAQSANSCAVAGATPDAHVWLEITINSLTRRYEQ